MPEDLADFAAAAFGDRGYFVGELDGVHSKVRMTIDDNRPREAKSGMPAA